MSLFDALASSHLERVLTDRALRRCRSFTRLLTKYVGLESQMSVSELVRALVDEIGIPAALKEENTHGIPRPPREHQELVSALSEFGEHHPAQARWRISWRKSRWSPTSTWRNSAATRSRS